MNSAEMVVAYRKKVGLTQRELAKAVGVSLPTISRWERGVTEPSYSELSQIASLADSQTPESVNPLLPPTPGIV